MQYSSNYSGIFFCPLKIRITQFPGGFRVKPISITKILLVCFFKICTPTIGSFSNDDSDGNENDIK